MSANYGVREVKMVRDTVGLRDKPTQGQVKHVSCELSISLEDARVLIANVQSEVRARYEAQVDLFFVKAQEDGFNSVPDTRRVWPIQEL